MHKVRRILLVMDAFGDRKLRLDKVVGLFLFCFCLNNEGIFYCTILGGIRENLTDIIIGQIFMGQLQANLINQKSII